MLIFQLPPTLSIFGYKGSGKTTITEKITQHLTSRNIRILSAKHVGEPEFTLDQPGSDSYRHVEAGATATLLHSDASTTLLFANPARTLQELIHRGLAATFVDVILLEGFRFWTYLEPEVGKIVCVRTTDEITELTENLQGPLVAICTLTTGIKDALLIPKEMSKLLKAVDDWLIKVKPLTKRE